MIIYLLEICQHAICFLRAKLYTNLNIIEIVSFTKQTKTDAHKYQSVNSKALLFLISLHFKDCFELFTYCFSMPR